MDYGSVKTACIVGAGVAGLATAKALRGEGVACTVLDRNDRIGGVWTDGYLDFGVQVEKALYEFPDFPLPDDVPDYTPGPVFQDYLERYADHFRLRDCIRLGVFVDRVEPLGHGAGWTVTFTQGGDRRTQSFDLVVICVGLYSNTPHVPELAGTADFTGETLHVSDFKSAEALKGRRVAVVGFGKSATDAALAAKDHADTTHIVARRLHWPIPRRLAGLVPFKWGLLNRLTSTLIPAYKSPTALERRVHTLGRPLVWLYWRVVELLLVVQCGLWSRFGTRQSLVPETPVEIGAFNEATMLPRPDFFKWVRKGRIDLHKGSVERLLPHGAKLKNGSTIDVDTIVFATGWRSDYRFLSPALQQRLGFADDGLYLYRQMLHPAAPGLAFVGYASTVSNTLAYAMQARWLAALISRAHDLPSVAEQMQEIARLRRWKRRWMPTGHARAARLLVHMQHYLDELMRDIGADPLRKRGFWAPLAEVFAPYQPRDYRDVAANDWERREQSRKQERCCVEHVSQELSSVGVE